MVPSRISCIPARTPREASLKPKVIPGRRGREKTGGEAQPSYTLSRDTAPYERAWRKNVEERGEIKRRG